MTNNLSQFRYKTKLSMEKQTYSGIKTRYKRALYPASNEKPLVGEKFQSTHQTFNAEARTNLESPGVAAELRQVGNWEVGKSCGTF